MKRYSSAREYTPWAFKNLGKGKLNKKLQILPPCTFGEPIIEYFNREDVRK